MWTYLWFAEALHANTLSWRLAWPRFAVESFVLYLFCCNAAIHNCYYLEYLASIVNNQGIYQQHQQIQKDFY